MFEGVYDCPVSGRKFEVEGLGFGAVGFQMLLDFCVFRFSSLSCRVSADIFGKSRQPGSGLRNLFWGSRASVFTCFGLRGLGFRNDDSMLTICCRPASS